MNGEVTRQTAVGAGVCGVLLLVCGVGCLIPGFVLIANGDANADGLWSGVLLLIAGVLGMVTWWKRHRGVIIGFLVVTICVVIAMFIESIIAGVRYAYYKEKASWYCQKTGFNCKCYQYGYAKSSKDLYCDQSKMDSIIGSLLTIVIFSVIGGIASFTGSIFGCMGTCSTQGQPGTVVVQSPVVMTTTLPGYSVQQPGYSIQQPGYLVQQPGYSVQQPGHQAPQSDYQASKSGYKAPQSGYLAPQSDYQAPQSGHQAPGSDYQAPSSGYQAPQPADIDPQASSSQQQVPDEPPPQYTKHPL